MLQYQLVQPTMQSSCFFPQIMQNTGFSLSPTFSKIYCALFRKATKHLFSRSGEIQLFCDFSASDFDFCWKYFLILSNQFATYKVTVRIFNFFVTFRYLLHIWWFYVISKYNFYSIIKLMRLECDWIKSSQRKILLSWPITTILSSTFSLKKLLFSRNRMSSLLEMFEKTSKHYVQRDFMIWYFVYVVKFLLI